MIVKQLLFEELKKRGYEGLYTDDCACDINDLAPCGCSLECELGYYQKLTAQQIEDGIDFSIGQEKIKL